MMAPIAKPIADPLHRDQRGRAEGAVLEQLDERSARSAAGRRACARRGRPRAAGQLPEGDDERRGRPIVGGRRSRDRRAAATLAPWRGRRPRSWPPALVVDMGHYVYGLNRLKSSGTLDFGLCGCLTASRRRWRQRSRAWDMGQPAPDAAAGSPTRVRRRRRRGGAEVAAALRRTPRTGRPPTCWRRSRTPGCWCRSSRCSARSSTTRPGWPTTSPATWRPCCCTGARRPAGAAGVHRHRAAAGVGPGARPVPVAARLAAQAARPGRRRRAGGRPRRAGPVRRRGRRPDRGSPPAGRLGPGRRPHRLDSAAGGMIG